MVLAVGLQVSSKDFIQMAAYQVTDVIQRAYDCMSGLASIPSQPSFPSVPVPFRFAADLSKALLTISAAWWIQYAVFLE